MNNVQNFAKKYNIVLVMIILILIMGVAKPGAFLTVNNLFTVLRQSSIMGIATVGLLFVMLAGGIDLAIGSVMSISCVMSAIMIGTWHVNMGLAALISILVSGTIGLVYGTLIIKTGIPPMIGTLAFLTLLQGVAYLICNGMPVYGIPDFVKQIGQGYVGPIPIPVIIFAVVATAAGVVLNWMHVGRCFYAIGSNAEATRLSGINVEKYQIGSYVISSVLAGLAGVVMLGRIATGQPTAGKGYEMQCLTAAVIGGVSLAGGEGKISKTITGVLIMGILTNGMTILNINDYYQMVVQGAILLFAVCSEGIQRNWFKRSKRMKKHVLS